MCYVPHIQNFCACADNLMLHFLNFGQSYLRYMYEHLPLCCTYFHHNSIFLEIAVKFYIVYFQVIIQLNTNIYVSEFIQITQDITLLVKKHYLSMNHTGESELYLP